MVKLRLSQKANLQTDLIIDEYYSKLIATIHDDVFCLGDKDPATHLSEYLIQEGITFTTAESCTGGFIANRLMQTPGISAVFSGSIVCYSNDVKISELGVDEAIIQEFGAVSEPCAMAMARGVRKNSIPNYPLQPQVLQVPMAERKKNPLASFMLQ